MGKSFLKIKKEKKQRRLATLRYILPFAFSVILGIVFSLPVMFFTDYTGDKTTYTSIFARIGENFSAARTALLDGSVEDAAYLNFSSLIMSVCVILVLLFALGTLVGAFYMITGLLHLYTSDKGGKLRRIYVTLVWNKAVVLILSLLSIAPAFFPMILVGLIDRILMVYAKAHYPYGNPLILCVLLWCAVVVLFILTSKHDTAELNIFAKQKRKEEVYEECDTTEAEDASPLYRMTRLSKEEQAENIRKLLNKSKSEDNDNG